MRCETCLGGTAVHTTACVSSLAGTLCIRHFKAVARAAIMHGVAPTRDTTTSPSRLPLWARVKPAERAGEGIGCGVQGE